MLVLLLAALGGLIALLAVNLNDNSDAGTKLVAVDSVLGFPQADAERRLTAAGFKPFAIVETNAATPGTVFAQNPQAGAKVASGSTVDIHVSAPLAKVAVPDVVGKTKDAATSAIYAGNLLPNISQEPSDTVPADTVIRQSPAGGTMLDPKSEINLVVSAGKGQAVVPNLRGHPSATAANELGAAGFQVATQQAPAYDVGAGDVISSNPPAGTVLDRGSTVTLIISTGPPSTTSTAPAASTTTTPSSTDSAACAPSCASANRQHLSRKFLRRSWPLEVRIDSGWNCTPSTSYWRWRRPITIPSSVSAVISSMSGTLARSTTSEWYRVATIGSGRPSNTPTPVWWITDVLPCMTCGARTTAPP